MSKEKACAERVQKSKANRLEDLRVMIALDEAEGYSVDDLTGEQLEKLGIVDIANESEGDAQLELLRGETCPLFEYGLSFTYIEPDTYDDQPEGWVCYLISTGGPSEEIRYYVNPDGSVHRIEFWFLDWFDGAPLILDGDDKAIALQVYEMHGELYGATEGKYGDENGRKDGRS